MNAPPYPSPDPDEQASALVDGLLSPEEADRARQDPAVARRIEEIVRVRNQLRMTPPPPPDHADRAVAAAVAAFDPSVRPLRPPAPAAPPGASSSGSRAARWLAAAAAIVVVALVAAVGLTSGGGDETADMSSGEPDSVESGDEDSGGAGDDAESESAPQASEESTTDSPMSDDGASRSAVVDLGVVNDPDELNEAVATAVPPAAPSTGEGGADASTSLVPDSCPGRSPEGDAARGTSVFVGRADYRGEDVVVHVYEVATDDSQRLVATNPSCVAVVDQPYDG